MNKSIPIALNLQIDILWTTKKSLAHREIFPIFHLIEFRHIIFPPSPFGLRLMRVHVAAFGSRRARMDKHVINMETMKNPLYIHFYCQFLVSIKMQFFGFFINSGTWGKIREGKIHHVDDRQRNVSLKIVEAFAFHNCENTMSAWKEAFSTKLYFEINLEHLDLIKLNISNR